MDMSQAVIYTGVMDFDDDIIRAHMQSFGYLLSHCHAVYQRGLLQAIEGTGLHMGHVVVLASLWQHQRRGEDPDLTQTRLVQVSGVEKSSLVLFLDALEKDGWVERRRHPTDRRAHLVHLTDSGRERFERVGYRLYQCEQAALSPFSPDEQAQMKSLLSRLLIHLQGDKDLTPRP